MKTYLCICGAVAGDNEYMGETCDRDAGKALAHNWIEDSPNVPDRITPGTDSFRAVLDAWTAGMITEAEAESRARALLSTNAQATIVASHCTSDAQDTKIRCIACKGSGWIFGDGEPRRACSACGGKGSTDETRGLYQKYEVRRLHDDEGKHDACDYFVLDLTHDENAKLAASAYASACEAKYPQLAADLRARVAGERSTDYAPAEDIRGELFKVGDRVVDNHGKGPFTVVEVFTVRMLRVEYRQRTERDGAVVSEQGGLEWSEWWKKATPEDCGSPKRSDGHG